MLIRHRPAYLLCISAAALITAAAGPRTIAGFARLHEPFAAAFFAVENWRHPGLAPRDAGDGRFARELRLSYPMALARDGAGAVYVGDRRGKLIWKIGLDGRAHLFAGTGRRGPDRSGPARAVALGSPEGMCIAPDGSVLLADMFDHVVVRITQDGKLERIAGTGAAGFSGDGGPAIRAQFDAPYDVAVNSRGEIFVADFDNHRIRKIDRRGIVTTFAGTTKGYSGDGGPASRAQLNGPYGVHVDGAGNVLIADSLNHVIRRVGAGGVIRTIAGNGVQGHSGDGGPALKASFNTPQALCSLGDGRLLIGDEHNDAVRVLTSDGVVREFAGPIRDPEYLLALADGSVLISEGAGGRVLRVLADGRTETFAGAAPR